MESDSTIHAWTRFRKTFGYDNEEVPSSLLAEHVVSNSSSGGSSRTTSTYDDKETAWGNVLKHFFLNPVFDSIDELRLISCTVSPIAEPYHTERMEYRTISERFGGAVEYGDYRVGQLYTDMHKIQKEISITIFLLEKIIKEMTEYGTATMVTEYIAKIRSMQKDEQELIQEVEEKRKLVSSMKLALRQEREISKRDNLTYNESIKESFSMFTNEAENSAIEIKYYRNWQDVRYEQNKMILDTTEEDYFDIVMMERERMALEDHCHDELELFIQMMYEEHLEDIQTWMKNYETTIESKDMDIYNLQMAREKMRDELEEMTSVYEQRAIEIEEYLEYKKQKEVERELLKLQTRAATKIQAWWRGIMFRKYLKSHRKKGRKGSKRDKNKKKKTK